MSYRLTPIIILFLIGHSSAPLPVVADCASLQWKLSQDTDGRELVIRLKENSVCHMAPLEIVHRKNIRLDGGNSMLIFSGDVTGIHIGDESENISISNLNIDYDPLPFTQGIIDQIWDGYFSFSIMDYYPPVGKNNNRVLIYDGTTRKLKTDGSTLYFKRFDIDQGGRSGRIPISPDYQAPLHTGDLIAFRPRGKPAIRLDGLSRNIRLDGISILSSPGMGIMGRYLDGNNYVHVRITPGKAPFGSDRDRLLSVNADGVNFAYGRKGPTIENSRISRPGDDGINLHGLILGISSITGPDKAIIFRPFGHDDMIERILRPGDDVRFLARDDFHVLGRARIKLFSAMGSYRLGPAVGNIFPRALPEGAKAGTFYAISISGGIPSGAAYIDAMSAASAGFIIRNTTISSNRGHGIVVGASNGEITGNVISGTTHNGIIVGPNFSPWREGSWPSHITITGNSIIDPCTDGLSGRKLNERSSLYIGGDSEGRSTDISNISVSRNSIESCRGRWIKANNVNGIVLSNNIFVNDSGRISRKSCRDIPVTAVENARSAQLRSNQCIGTR